MNSQLKSATVTPDTLQRTTSTTAAACKECYELLVGEGLEPNKVQVQKLFHITIAVVHIGQPPSSKLFSKGASSKKR